MNFIAPMFTKVDLSAKFGSLKCPKEGQVLEYYDKDLNSEKLKAQYGSAPGSGHSRIHIDLEYGDVRLVAK